MSMTPATPATIPFNPIDAWTNHKNSLALTGDATFSTSVRLQGFLTDLIHVVSECLAYLAKGVLLGVQCLKLVVVDNIHRAYTGKGSIGNSATDWNEWGDYNFPAIIDAWKNHYESYAKYAVASWISAKSAPAPTSIPTEDLPVALPVEHKSVAPESSGDASSASASAATSSASTATSSASTLEPIEGQGDAEQL